MAMIRSVSTSIASGVGSAISRATSPVTWARVHHARCSCSSANTRSASSGDPAGRRPPSLISTLPRGDVAERGELGVADTGPPLFVQIDVAAGLAVAAAGGGFVHHPGPLVAGRGAAVDRPPLGFQPLVRRPARRPAGWRTARSDSSGHRRSRASAPADPASPTTPRAARTAPVPASPRTRRRRRGRGGRWPASPACATCRRLAADAVQDRAVRVQLRVTDPCRRVGRA